MGYVYLLIFSINPFITSNASLYFQMPLPSTAFSSKKEMPPPTLLPRLTLYSALVFSKFFLYFPVFILYFHFLFLHIISILCLSSYPEFTLPSKKQKKNPWTHDFNNDPEFHHFFLLADHQQCSQFPGPYEWLRFPSSQISTAFDSAGCFFLLKVPSLATITPCAILLVLAAGKCSPRWPRVCNTEWSVSERKINIVH